MRRLQKCSLKNIPYDIRKTKDGKFEIIRKADGKVVGRSNSLKNAQGSIAHRMYAGPAKGSMLHGAIIRKK